MGKSFYFGAFSLASIIVLILVLGCGWVMNIIALANMASAVSGLGVLRIVGIFLAPLGGVLGYI